MFMKRLFTIVMMTLLSVALISCSSPQGGEQAAKPELSPNANQILLIRAKEGTNDFVIAQHLKNLGYTVREAADNELHADMFQYYGVVFVTNSVNHSKIKEGLLKNSPISVIYAKPDTAIADGVMTANSPGVVSDVKTVSVTNTEHPLSAGFNGDLVIYKENSTITYGSPGEEATVVATMPGEQNKPTLFAYEKGAKGTDGQPFSSRRAFINFASGNELNMSADGWKLFDNAIEWAVGKK